jgi:excisionase family DNA binding protein
MAQKLKAIIYEQVPDGSGGYRLRPLTTTSTGLSVDLAAPILHLSRSTLYRLCQEGRMRFERPSPRRIVIPLEELMRYKVECADVERFERQQMDLNFGADEDNEREDAR